MGYSPRDCKESDTTEVTEQAQEFFIGFPGGSVVKNLPARRQGFDPWVRKIPWRRKWQPTLVFLGNPMDRGAWQATVHRIAESQTQLKQLSTCAHPACSHHEGCDKK